MQYHGKLYGKGHGKTYFPLVLTSEDVDKMETENAQMREALGHIRSILTEKDEHGKDLELGSTAFKSCLRWSSIGENTPALPPTAGSGESAPASPTAARD